MLRFDKATYLSILFKFILSVRWSNSQRRSDFPLFLEFIHIVSILFYNFIDFIILLYIFLVTLYILFDVFYLASFVMYYLLLLVQVLLVIFEAFFFGVNILIRLAKSART